MSIPCLGHMGLPVAKDFHFCLSSAVFLATCHFSPLFTCIFYSVILHDVLFTIPIFFLPSGVHFKAVHCKDSCVILIMWPVLHQLLLSVTANDGDFLWYLGRILLQPYIEIWFWEAASVCSAVCIYYIIKLGYLNIWSWFKTPWIDSEISLSFEVEISTHRVRHYY